MTEKPPSVGAVLIGRNEGARLVACLASVCRVASPVVYVDSGSSDGSVAAAQDAGAQVVTLDTTQPFTAARARNAGFAALMDRPDAPELVQFVDGDCEVQPDWISKATAFLVANPEVVAVCGRRRERFPESSVYNTLIDQEWDTPTGEARSCGGDVLMRAQALDAAGGYNAQLIAGEEPELCVRLRQAGWRIWRLDAEMTWHDADITRFGQWWKRTRRAGHAFAEGAALHGAPPERHNVRATQRALVWGAGLPFAILFGLLFTPWALALALLWPLKAMRLVWRGNDPLQSVFLTLGNIPEALGALEFYIKRLTGRQATLIEYK